MINRSIRTIILLLISTTLFTSCLEITEEININEDKSGDVKISMKLGGISLLTSLVGDQVDSETMAVLKKQPEESANLLNNCSGISNVKSNSFNSGTPGVSFDFQDGKSLNKAYYSLFNAEKKWYTPSVLKVKKHKVKRKNLGKLVLKRLNNNVSEETRRILAYVDLVTIVNLPEKAKNVKAEQYEYANDGKTVKMRVNLDRLLDGEETAGFIVNY